MTSKRTPSLGDHVPLDVERLLETRMALEANSGAGKSWALRRILEQTAGHCQQIVIDPEDEFHTLREHSGYVLCSPKGGDAVADCKSAALLARRLLECNVSAVVAIFELGTKRAEFVELFVDALVDAPRSLWHPVLIAIDEAGKYCPETDKAASTTSIINLLTLGRKRGFCGVLATQRISTLNKSALAECNNVLIGRTGLDIDIARAASILGMKLGDARDILKNLNAGEFYGYGPAISREVIRFTVGPVVTTHPKAGQRAIPPAPPTAAIREILGKFADLPAEAAEEAQTVDGLRAEITKLRSEATRHKNRPATPSPEVLENIAELRAEIRSLELQREDRDRQIRQLSLGIGNAIKELNLTAKVDRIDRGAPLPSVPVPPLTVPLKPTKKDTILITKEAFETLESLGGDGPSKMGRAILIALADHPSGLTKKEIFWRTRYSHGGASTKAFAELNRNGWVAVTKGVFTITPDGIVTLGRYEPLPLPTLSDMERAFLAALAQHPNGLTKKRIFVLTGYSHGGASTKTFSTLVKHGWVHGRPVMRITEDGKEVLGMFDPMPVGDELRQALLAGDKLSKMEKQILATICSKHPDAVTKKEIFEITGYSHGGASTAAFSRLVGLGYVGKAGSGKLVASSELFFS